MDLTKKSMKWLVAVFVVFAMILTAVFAAGNVATASANEEEQDATVHLWVTDSAALGTYPNLIRSAAQRTITVDYGFEITEESEFSIFAISPVLILEDNDPVKPSLIELNGMSWKANFAISVTLLPPIVSGKTTMSGIGVILFACFIPVMM